ncbi:uncharacterized protein HD556DRAFT_1440546 [Suillus plorans]|uniref:Uncharacterized protein n=1 Tax=Suillus plorans TaxID=116603 RepID=A0A9P7J0P2_9AGAM|nr:uncharacterized protein HD556DRAFT_1440546 [Suillus plorans]KAG1798210.1 hypothetical protein HD556DRAFT_1440546 [Suillus plorans]
MDQVNLFKQSCTPSADFTTEPITFKSNLKKRKLVCRIPLPIYYDNGAASSATPSPLPAPTPSPLPAPHLSEVPETPTPPYRQTPAPVTVSQSYLRKLVLERWEAEFKCCEEARKAQLLEVHLAALGITKLV